MAAPKAAPSSSSLPDAAASAGTSSSAVPEKIPPGLENYYASQKIISRAVYLVDHPDEEPELSNILNGVVAFVEMSIGNSDCSAAISGIAHRLGAVISKTFTKRVTHVFFSNGRKSTYLTAVERNLPLVSVTWLIQCVEKGVRVPEEDHPALIQDKYKDPKVRIRRPYLFGALTTEEEFRKRERRFRQQERAMERKDAERQARFDAAVEKRRQEMLARGELTPFDPNCVSPPRWPAIFQDLTRRLKELKFRFPEEDNRWMEGETEEEIRKCTWSLPRRLFEKDPTSPALRHHPEIQKLLAERGTPVRPEELVDPSYFYNYPVKNESESVENRSRADSAPIPENKANDTTPRIVLSNSPAHVTKRRRFTNKRKISFTSPQNRSPAPAKKRMTRNSNRELSNQNLKKRIRETKSEGADELESFQFIQMALAFPLVQELDQSLSEKSVSLEVSMESANESSLLDDSVFMRGAEFPTPETSLESNDRSLSESITSEQGAQRKRRSVQRTNVETELAKKVCTLSLAENSEQNEPKSWQNDPKSQQSGAVQERRSMDEFRTGPLIKRSYETKPRRSARRSIPAIVKRKIALTSFTPGERVHIVKLIHTLGGYEVTSVVDGNTQYLVCGDKRRTINVLNAMACGAWILSKDWVLRSSRAGRWLDEERFEMSDEFPAAKMIRLERASGSSPILFEPLGRVYIAQNTNPPSSALQLLCQRCGGRLVFNSRKADVVIGRYINKSPGVCVTERWLLDSLTLNRLIPFDAYLIPPPSIL